MRFTNTTNHSFCKTFVHFFPIRKIFFSEYNRIRSAFRSRIIIRRFTCEKTMCLSSKIFRIES